MILVDKELRERIHTEPSLITGCLSEEQIGAVSCDLTVSDIVNQKFRSGRFDLRPQAVVFVKTNEALHVHDDLLLLAPKKEQADPSEIPNLSSSNKDPDVLWNSMKNKFSRMPKDRMNYLIYYSTRFIGNKKPPKFYRPTKTNLLGRLCRNTGRSVTVIVISSLFTEEDAGMNAAQKHKRIMSVIGKKVFDRIIKES